MPATVEELHIGRRTSLKNAERQYAIHGVADEDDAYAALIAAVGGVVPLTINGMPIVPADCEVDEVFTDHFVGRAVYRTDDGGSYQQPGSFSIAFDISGQTQRVTQALDLLTYTDPAYEFVPSHGAINIQPDGSIEGVDIIVPAFTFVLNYTVDPSLINDSYIATVSHLVGKKNGASFKGFAAGELLFTRCSGQRRDSEAWDISFGWAVSENKEDVTIGGIDPFFKRGWDYLWVHYENEHITASNVVRPVPTNAYVCEVYPDGNMAALGLP